MLTKTIQFLLILILSPFLFGLINRTKAFFAGRKGSPLLQLYFDIFKLLRKNAIYSRSTTWVFIAGPIISLGAVILCALLIPFAGHESIISFEGDIILFIYLLGLARFFIVLSALDTGSSFEGMGASREVQFSVFAEPAMFLNIAVLARITGETSLSKIFSNNSIQSWSQYGPEIILIAIALFIIFLAENSRIPVDDPNTHLELTMIHEVMVLDHSGVELAYILSSAAMKFWILGTLITGVFLKSFSYGITVDFIIFIFAMFLLAVLVGITESIVARLDLLKVPHFLISALALAVIALILTMR